MHIYPHKSTTNPCVCGPAQQVIAEYFLILD